MIKYPLSFEVSSKSKGGVNTPFQGKALDLPDITCAIPPEFKGPGGGYSPEDLLGLSILTCVIATFKVFAEKTQLAFDEISGIAKLVIDRGEGGIPEIQRIDCTFNLTGVKDQEKAKKILAESEKYCIVSGAVKSEKTFTYNF